jgi:single-strand DNA-binding protein
MDFLVLFFVTTLRGRYFPTRVSVFSKGFLIYGEIIMSSLNQVNLIGNLGRAPEVLKSTEQGDFVRLSLATTKKYRSKDGKIHEDTQWHTVYLSNGLGKVASSYLTKGARIYISGELRTREWQNKLGQTLFSTAVFARDLKFLSIKPQEKKEFPDPVEDGAYSKAIEEIRDALGID